MSVFGHHDGLAEYRTAFMHGLETGDEVEAHARLEHRRIVLVDAHDPALTPIGRDTDADRVSGAVHEVLREACLRNDGARGAVDVVRGRTSPDGRLGSVQCIA